MKISKLYDDPTIDDELDSLLNEEIENSKDLINKYIYNVNSLLGKKRKKEVIKNMINILVEKL